MSTGKLLIAVLGAGALAIGPAPTHLAAQTCVAGNPVTCTVVVSLPVNAVTYLSVSPVSTALGAPSFAGTGTVDTESTAGPTVTVKSNAPFKVAVCAVLHSCTWTVTGGGSKAASDLQWGSVLGTYPNNAGAVANLFGPSAAVTASSSSPIFYRTLWNITSTPAGTYTMVINFTISAP